MAIRVTRIKNLVINGDEDLVSLEVDAKATTVGSVNLVDPAKIVAMDFAKIGRSLTRDKLAPFNMSLVVSKKMIKDLAKKAGFEVKEK